MNLLVLVQNYPDNSDTQRYAYVHTRNKYYAEMGVNVIVLAFDANKEYVFENVTVTNLKMFRRNYNIKLFDAIISHAPNLRNHLGFLYFYAKSKRIFFFIHGHEVLKKNNYYPPPFSIFKTKLFIIKRTLVNVYDNLKLALLRVYFSKKLVTGEIKIVFVSEWMKKEFSKNININEDLLQKNSIIIYNCAARQFIDYKYTYYKEEPIKIITIRQFDNPKYAVDLVLKAAIDNPDIEFHLFGEGKFFEYFKAPENLKIINEYFTHQELPQILNRYAAAFMPTRLDSQGVMMCEMATYGIPLITSDLPICREMLKEFSNIFFISNDSEKIQLNNITNQITVTPSINKAKFSFNNTILEELKYFHKTLYNSEFISRII